MHILYVGTLPPHPGGSAIVGGQLVAGLAERGHSVRALAPMTEAALASGDAYAAGHPAVAITRYRVPRFQATVHRPDPAFRAMERDRVQAPLAALLAEQRPDVLIIGRENFLWYALDPALRHGIPTLLIVHNPAGAGAFNGLLREEERRDMIERFLRVDRVIVVASHLAARYAEIGRTVDVVRNGVDVDRFRPGARPGELAGRLSVNAHELVVVHVSNLKDIKRPLDIVESAARALAVRPDLLYVIVGDGEMRAPMEARSHQLGIASRVRFVGWVDHGEIPGYLRLADVVVMPSASEALALVYLEAQASGRVLVASDIPAAREVVEDGVDGLLFPTGDVETLTSRTLEAAGDPALRGMIGSKARQRATGHPLSAVLDRYASILGELA